MIKKYCDEQTWHWRYKTKLENQFLLDLLVEIIGDKKIGALTPSSTPFFGQVLSP